MTTPPTPSEVDVADFATMTTPEASALMEAWGPPHLTGGVDHVTDAAGVLGKPAATARCACGWRLACPTFVVALAAGHHHVSTLTEGDR